GQRRPAPAAGSEARFQDGWCSCGSSRDCISWLPSTTLPLPRVPRSHSASGRGACPVGALPVTDQLLAMGGGPAMRRLELALLCLVRLLPGRLRLRQLALGEFRGEEPRGVEPTLQIAEGTSFPLVSGRSSTGVNYPPPALYLLVPPMWVSPSPLALSAWVA